MASGAIMQGHALVVEGRHAEGIDLMQQSLITYRQTGTQASLGYYLGLLAKAYRQQGQLKQGLDLIAEALEVARKSDNHAYEAELYRLKGELLLACTSASVSEAAACFHQALDMARGQQAQSLELRAAVSLARLWRRQDKIGEARELLAPVYSWFTEGFDTPDLQAARALLDRLRIHFRIDARRRLAYGGRLDTIRHDGCACGYRCSSQAPPPSTTRLSGSLTRSTRSKRRELCGLI